MRNMTLLSAAGALMAVVPVHGGMINLPGGWQATWDASLDPYVDIVAPTGTVTTVEDPINPGTFIDILVIQKSAEFIQPPPFPGFPFPTIPITFTQTDVNAVNHIVIDDEIITNSTGVDWTDFHMTILNHDDAFFDPARTANSGGGGPLGFTITPFQQMAFSPDNRSLDIWDGLVPTGSQWFPGNGATDGQLWMSVNTGTGSVDDPLTTFVLKETPTPTPGSIALFVIGGLTVAGRRRWSSRPALA